MPFEGRAGAPVLSGPALRLDYRKLVDGSVAVTVFCGAIALVEPSPYDFASIVAIALWALGGFRVGGTALLFIGLIGVYNFGGFVSLIPHLDEPLPTLFMLQSLYLAITAVFFVLYFSEDTVQRTDQCLQAFTLGTLLAAVCGILGYFNVAGTGSLFSLYGRASGTFKDPNVLGSYLILGALTLMQRLLLGRTRRPIVTTLGYLVVVAGVFLSFSRGSWLAFAIATALTTALTYATAPTLRARRHILTYVGLAAALAVLVIVGLLADSHIRSFFLERAAVTQDYDVGETGRFGNQLRSLDMLLDRVNGFGPLRFRLTFGLDPHNSYINAFASYGWLGATAFFLLVGLTVFIGFRVAIVPSPYRRVAQVFWPALLVFLLQGFQIDIDHWRHVYLMLAVVWALEGARLRGAAASRPPQAARVASASFPTAERPVAVR
ncbi:O-antigen ligase family protein [Lichenihabitans sp. Uapishka_5]|uniref:O-antigen ligase family protein n=1 Tax=Lichenihabitans sp. Uapishka_5 TaxID=3037302 RepID=UPI0029E81542|nr:O-antigen ligase family protein [Lichenihabitans sp. Uapishka_5]MDX7949847.1 O-antigen ligase family protein [Lichenihabitans sp. Uapishka_5]